MQLFCRRVSLLIIIGKCERSPESNSFNCMNLSFVFFSGPRTELDQMLTAFLVLRYKRFFGCPAERYWVHPYCPTPRAVTMIKRVFQVQHLKANLELMLGVSLIDDSFV